MDTKQLIKQLITILNRAAGTSGSDFLASGATKSGSWSSFLVNTELEIAAITSTDTRMQSFVGETLSAGTLITVAEGHKITSIESTSGDAVLYV